jgi:hopanoid biosynthesis associated RND transporter like protein HpnN
MSRATDSLMIKTIHWWEKNILNRPWLLIVSFVIATGLVGKYTMDNLTVNTNTADMISTQLPFQQNRIKLEKSFPQDVNTILVLVEGDSPEQTSAVVKHISAELRENTAVIKSVHVPDEGEFFDRNGLLYLSLKDLEGVSKQLVHAQPFIGKLSKDNSLHGLFDILGLAIKATGEDELELDANPVFRKVSQALDAVREGKPRPLSWQQLMMGKQSGLGTTKRFIIVTPNLDYTELLPAETSIAVIKKSIAHATAGELAGVRVSMTGEVVLEYEELDSITRSTMIAGIASFILVCLTLWIAYRSFKLMIATFISLGLGLVLSMGFATVSIGHLNLISIAFAVLFIGMGDAFSSHFCLRYRELIMRGESQRDALLDTLTSTGSSLILCAFTAAIGLYAFIPTHYVGVSELGVIAGTSMFIALLTTFTVLPALMKIMPIRRPRTRTPAEPVKSSFLHSNWPLRHARPIRWTTFALTLVALALLTKVSVDFNPINLRDQSAESVKTFKYLLQDEATSPMTLSSLAASEQESMDKKSRFEKLPTVEKVTTLFDLIPDDQQAKLAIIEEMGLLLGPQLGDFPAPAQSGAQIESLEELQASILVQIAKGEGGNADLLELSVSLDNFLDYLDSLPEELRPAILDKLQQALLSALPATMQKLKAGLEAEPVTLESLPTALKRRWLSENGLYRVQVTPKKDLNDLENLREFIREAQKVDPDVTDLPVTYLESMNEVIQSFVQAFSIALVAITLLLLVILRSVKDTLLVLLPLLLASVFTAAATVVFKVPFNFANIIALPLLFGLGVDSGIHMVHRLHYLDSDEESLLGTSEAQGVFYGALTTIFSFSSLAFTSHQGTASMGILLSVGLLMTLICALVVLPAFSVWHIRRRRIYK